MFSQRRFRAMLLGGMSVALGLGSTLAAAADAPTTSNRLLLTGGVSQIEGAAGGGLTPWAVIAGYGTRDEIGATAFATRVNVQDYHLNDVGAAVGFYDRVELSVAQQRFNTEDVGAALGLGRGFTFKQTVVGVKVRLFGDAVLDQDSWLPQVSIGAQYKKNDQDAVVKFVGAKRSQGTDYYISATKLVLSQSVLLNATVRLTKANQTGILGFGGDKRGFDCFEIAHFADQNYVGVLSERTAQRFGERARIDIDFSLRDKRFFVLVQKFNRVFNRYDVRISALIDVFDHRRQSRRFSRAGRSGNQNQPAIFFGNL